MVVAASRQADFSEIPVIDIDALGRGDAAEGKVIGSIRQACEEVGFFYISNHGVSQPLIDELFVQSERFFQLPETERHKIHVAQSSCFRGYHPSDTLGPDAPRAKIPNMLDSFNVATDLSDTHPYVEAGVPLYGANQWPQNLPGFRETVTRYDDQLLHLKTRLLSAFAMALDLPRDYFDAQYSDPLTQMRLLHYPPQPAEDVGDRIGSQPHADSGAFTILLQGAVGGLEVMNKSGEWIMVPPIRGTFVVNVAELMSCVSNNRFSSTRHRVINRSGQERFSVPFFVSPNYEAVVETHPQFIDDDEPSRFPPIHVGPYTLSLYRQLWPTNSVSSP
jgi:isopenicillin N synthase-like dioxygenase